MIWLYRLLFAPAFLILLPKYLRRMLRRGGYGPGFSQRFGRVAPLPAKKAPRIWIQAVSVGELLALGPLLDGLRAAGSEIYLTTTTSTGYTLVKERYAAKTIGYGYFPLDAWPCSTRAWRAINPDRIILLEGERWPEHLHQARKRGLPLFVVNARMSDRSYRRLRRFPLAATLGLAGVTRVLAASATDASRFRELGVPAERVIVTGNLKLDVSIPRLADDALATLRSELGLPAATPLLVGASTWPGEEAALLAAFAAARAAGLSCALLLVPRHAERRGELEAALARHPWRVHFRSRGPAPAAAPRPVDIAVGDTTGELQKFLQLADLVFVGKSLPPHTEGQTPVEAAALGRPILFGPGMANFRGIARELLARRAARQVASSAELTEAVRSLLRDPASSAALGAAACAWREENRGALERTLAALTPSAAPQRTPAPPPVPPPASGVPARN